MKYTPNVVCWKNGNNEVRWQAEVRRDEHMWREFLHGGQAIFSYYPKGDNYLMSFKKVLYELYEEALGAAERELHRRSSNEWVECNKKDTTIHPMYVCPHEGCHARAVSGEVHVVQSTKKRKRK